MDRNTDLIVEKRLERLAKKLAANGIEAVVVQTAAEVLPMVKQRIPEGAVVAAGGSMTLEECGVMAHLRSGRYQFLDRFGEGADRQAMQVAALSAEVYLASANAVTDRGEIYEIDNAGNRVAALAYGPERVILVIGANKLVPDLDAARSRRALLAAPANAVRVGFEVPCRELGYCVDCNSPNRICNAELVLYRQKPGRMQVILVQEALGY